MEFYLAVTTDNTSILMLCKRSEVEKNLYMHYGKTVTNVYPVTAQFAMALYCKSSVSHDEMRVQ